jgi:hypothetical protein
MAPLASPTELAARLNTIFDAGQAAQAEQLLNEASALVRNAAGGQMISLVEGDTFTVEAPTGLWLDLPQLPVQQVTAVLVIDQPVTDYQLVGNRLFRRSSWDNRYRIGSWWPWFPEQFPYTVTVTYDHGLASDDDRIALAKGACMAIATQAVINPGGVAAESIDDYRVQFRADAQPLEMTEALEKRLMRAYGRSAFSVRPQVRL